MLIVTAAEMREIDRRTTEQFGVPSLVLMENAGNAVARFVLDTYPRAKRIAVICGKGNNGGDGFVAARRLHEGGKKVGVLVLGHAAELKGDAKQMYAKLPVTALHVESPEALLETGIAQLFKTADLLLDAVVGTGFKPPLNALGEAVGDLFLESRAPAVSIDLPSGTDADSMAFFQESAYRSSAIVSFTAPKLAHVFSNLTAGPIVIADIGSPEATVQSKLNLDWTGDCGVLYTRRRAVNSNKGNFGHVLAIGGSVGKAGAPAMVGMAALKCGAGLVTAAVPRSVLAIVAGFGAEMMTEPLDETAEGTVSVHAAGPAAMQKLLERKAVVAVGPGLSTNAETVTFVRKFVQQCHAPLVLDADGINAFAGQPALLDGSKRPLALTPHPGEMARLKGVTIADIESDRLNTAREFAVRHKVCLVLKGWRTLVARPDGRVSVNTTGNPGMAKGGAGDVLTGLIAGSIAQFGQDGSEAFGDSVCAAVYLHGLAADLEVENSDEHTLMATDIIRSLPQAIRAICAPASEWTWLKGVPPSD